MSRKPSLDMICALNTYIDFLYPENYQINEKELRIHLSNICRYQGAIQISVLNHLALCSQLCMDAELWQYLLPDSIHPLDPIYMNLKIQKGYVNIHDWAEGILGDIPTGLKKLLPEYQALEHKWDHHIHDQLKLPLIFANERFIKVIDHNALVIEMTLKNHPAATKKQNDYKDILVKDLPKWTAILRETISQKPSAQWNRYILPGLHKAQEELQPYLKTFGSLAWPDQRKLPATL